MSEGDGDGEVRCVGCHREVRAGTLEVVSEGGGRRSEHPERAELDAVERWARGELPPIVATCPRCGQPMVGRGMTPIRWTLDAGDVSYVVHPAADGGGGVGAVIGPHGGTTLAIAAAAVRAAHPRADYPTDPVGAARFGLLTVFQVALIGLMLAPLAVWLFSIAFVTLFLSHAGDP